jgi:hypothetical protein
LFFLSLLLFKQLFGVIELFLTLNFAGFLFCLVDQIRAYLVCDEALNRNQLLIFLLELVFWIFIHALYVKDFSILGFFQDILHLSNIPHFSE